MMPAMKALSDCLGSARPHAMDTRLRIPQLSDPVAWSLELIVRNAAQARLQIRERATAIAGEAAGTTTHLDPMDQATLARFARGIVAEEPMHGSLDLLQYGSDGGTVRDGADWVWNIARDNFVSALQARNPLGFYIKGTLWLSAGEHNYEAHCDLADGFLIHLRGRKRVRIWPVPERYRRLEVFNHEDFAGRMCETPESIDLEPGQILFIPAGAMHDVVASRAGPAVSVSLHMGSPYPLLTLCDELNALLGHADVSVPAHLQSREKFGIHLFEPARFAREEQGPRDRIPPALVEALIGVLQTRETDRDALSRLLAQWWKNAVASPHYQTPYP